MKQLTLLLFGVFSLSIAACSPSAEAPDTSETSAESIANEIAADATTSVTAEDEAEEMTVSDTMETLGLESGKCSDKQDTCRVGSTTWCCPKGKCNYDSDELPYNQCKS